MGARDDLLAIPNEALRTGNIAAAGLVFMDFGTGTKRWWTGFGNLIADGEEWQGTGDVISISDTAALNNLDAEALLFSMAATPEMIALVQAAATAVRGREIKLFEQMFLVNPADDTMPWQVLGPPLALFSGTMEQISYSASGPFQRQIQLICESYFVRRNAPPRGQLTDLDQKARYSGDRGLERVPRYQNYTTRWL